MNPLLIKFGAPLAIIGIIAAMRWFNVKASGEPFFPGVGDSETSSKKQSGNALPKIPGFGQEGKEEIQDGGEYAETFSDVNSTGDITSMYAGEESFTSAPSLIGVSASHASADVGGVQFLPQALQQQQLANIINNPQPSYVPWTNQPSSPTPQTNTPVNQFGGGASGGKVYAL